MKALVLEAYKKFVYKEVPNPTMAPDEVLVKVEAAGICGSDVHGMDGSTGRRVPPLIMGHEAAGSIEALGDTVSGWSVGERVTFDSTIYRPEDWYSQRGMYNLGDGRMVLGVSPGEWKREGAFAEYVSIPQHILHRIPDGVSYTQAAMVEPVAVAAHAVSLTPLHKDDLAVVVGAGMIGLFVIQVLRTKGCTNIIAVDLDEGKLELARKLGADIGLNPKTKDVRKEVQKLSGGRGADVVFEVVGVQEAIDTAISCVRRGAVLTLVGNAASSVNVPLQKLVTEQIRLQGSCAICGEYPEVLDMIARSEVDVNAILSAESPLSEGASWFKRLYDKEPGLIKVVLKPWL